MVKNYTVITQILLPDMTHILPDLLPALHSILDEASAIALRYFRTELPIDYKADNSPVSLADKAIEEQIHSALTRAFPDDSIIGEEFGTHTGSSDYQWVIDPIDGTQSFISGKPSFGILIALCHHNRPILGIITQPFTGERWIGMQDHKALYRRDSEAALPITARAAITHLADARIATTSPVYFTQERYASFAHVTKQCRDVIYGGDCYNYALLASGYLDIVMESGLKPYDVMALVPVITQAGGVITNWDGSAVTLDNCSHIIASANPTLHSALLDCLA